jgi:uncharacterized protein (DUF58 family)
VIPSNSARLANIRTRIRRWAIRGKAPEPQPITLRQARVYVLPSRSGWAILLALVAMFVAAINYNLSLGFALVFLLASIGVVHIFHSWRTLARLQISLQPPGEAFAGRPANWRISLINNQGLTRRAVRILDGDGHECQCADIPAHTSLTLPLALSCPIRGRHRPGQLSVETRQPLGWIRAWCYIEPDTVAIVFPAPVGNLPLPVQSGTPTDNQRTQIPGQDDFAGLRGFHPGDSLKHIAWKQLARGQGMLTKTFASGQTTGCILNWHELPPGLSREARLSQLAQWVLDARQTGLSTTLILPGQRLGPGQDATHHLTCLTHLALFGEKVEDV